MMMDVDDCTDGYDYDPGKLSYRGRNVSYGGGCHPFQYNPLELESSIWNLLEWADSQRLSARKSIQKERAIRLWLQPLVSATEEKINLFHNDFKRKVGRISQKEVQSLLRLEHNLKRSRSSFNTDRADQCLLYLRKLFELSPHVYRKLLLKWVVMEFSRKETKEDKKKRLPSPPPPEQDFRHIIKRKVTIPTQSLNDPRRNHNFQSKSNERSKQYSNSENGGYLSFFNSFKKTAEPKPKQKLEATRLMVGNVKENQKFPSFGWIFPCVTCFQPTSNTFQRVHRNIVADIHMCKKCHEKHDCIIPKDIINGTRNNTRVVRL